MEFWGLEKSGKNFPGCSIKDRLMIKTRLVSDWQTALQCNPGWLKNRDLNIVVSINQFPVREFYLNMFVLVVYF